MPTKSESGPNVRFMTYNIRHAQGMDGWISVGRIARVVGDAVPDVVGLNEVWHIKWLLDQSYELGKRLGMQYGFEPNHKLGLHTLGNTVLTRGTLLNCENLVLPKHIEARGCLLAEIEVDGVSVVFASTHLSLLRRTRAEQIEFLAEKLPVDRPLVLAGDLNCVESEIGPLASVLNVIDCPPASYPSAKPMRALDHIAFSRHWTLDAIETIPTRASDHLPVVADLTLATAD